MSLSSATLSSIQSAGAAVFAADVELKNAVTEYAQRVSAAMTSNPYGLGNDTLFENWKVLARLSQSMAGIEQELRKVYRVAADLSADDQPVVLQVAALAAPTPSVEAAAPNQNDLAPTDVSVKTRNKPAQRVARSSGGASAGRGRAQRADASVTGLALAGNAAKLLHHLETLLNAHEFTAVSQTAIGQKIGIPMGSMTAATKKLIETGRIVAGPSGCFRLANSPTPSA